MEYGYRFRSRVVPTVTSSYMTDKWEVFNGTCANPLAKVSGSSGPYSTVTSSGTDEMEDVVTEGFKKSSNKGKITNSPMVQRKVTNSNTIGTYDVDNTYWLTSCTPSRQLLYGETRLGHTGLGANLPFASDPTLLISKETLIDLAVTQAWSKVNQSKAAILATLGEAKESINGLISIFARLIRIIAAVKRADWRYLKGFLTPRQISDYYMEWRYAIRPLIYDAEQIIDAINHIDPTHDRQTFRGWKRTSRTNESVTELSTWPLAPFKPLCSSSTTVEIDVRAGVLCQICPPSIIEVWGGHQLFETAWELIPFSFIIDWFFNVGSTIASWVPSASAKALASWVVVTETTTRTARVGSVNSYPVSGRNYRNLHCYVSGISRFQQQVTKTRTPEPQRSIFPTFDLRLDTLKLLDLVIIAQKLWHK